MSGNALQLSQELRLAQHGGALYSQHLLSHFPPSLSALSSQWNLWNQGHHHRDGFEAERLFSVVPGVPLRQDFGMSRSGPCQPRWMVWAGRWAIYPVLPNLPCFLCRFSHLSRSRRRCTKPRANKTMVLSLESRFDLHSRFRSAHCCVYLFVFPINRANRRCAKHDLCLGCKTGEQSWHALRVSSPPEWDLCCAWLLHPMKALTPADSWRPELWLTLSAEHRARRGPSPFKKCAANNNKIKQNDFGKHS